MGWIETWIDDQRRLGAVPCAAIEPPILRPADANRMRKIGEQLGEALDAGELPATRVIAGPIGEAMGPLSWPTWASVAIYGGDMKIAPPIPRDAPPPLVVWSPSAMQLLGRRVRRWLAKFQW